MFPNVNKNVKDKQPNVMKMWKKCDVVIHEKGTKCDIQALKSILQLQKCHGSQHTLVVYFWNRSLIIFRPKTLQKGNNILFKWWTRYSVYRIIKGPILLSRIPSCYDHTVLSVQYVGMHLGEKSPESSYWNKVTLQNAKLREQWRLIT